MATAAIDGTAEPMDFYEAELLAFNSVRARASRIPGLEGVPASPLLPWRWRRGKDSVEMRVRIVPAEHFIEEKRLLVRCAACVDVNVDASPQDGHDMDATLRLSNAVKSLGLEVAAMLRTRPIVRCIGDNRHAPAFPSRRP